MSALNKDVTHSALMSGSAQNVSEARRRAAAYIAAYPDIYAMAYAAARRLIRQRTGKSLDPSRVYWHRFTSANTSSTSFTGWEHVDPPKESMTLIQLLMVRFGVHDQSNVDELNVWGGFYLAGPKETRFGSHNEVPMLPSDVLEDFWKMDFAAECSTKVSGFWRDHSENFCIFAKSRLLTAASTAVITRQLTPQDLKTVLAAVTGSRGVDVPWPALKEYKQPAAGVSIQVFQLAGTDARTALLIRNTQGRHILYQPSSRDVFQCFDRAGALYAWVKQQMAESTHQAELIAQFVRKAEDQAAFANHVAQLCAQPYGADQSLIGFRIDQVDVFEQLRDRARQEMEEDVHSQLTSNASLRKQMAMGFLSFFIMAGSVASLLAWPIALVVVGACVANIGLSIDQAINGRTPQLRKAGVLGAIINSLYLLLNLPLLASMGGVARELPATAEEGAAAESVSEMRGNVVLPGTSASAGHLRGVQTLPDGETWITMNNLPYRVRYLDDMGTWAVVDPDEPFAFDNVYPVGLNEAGDWELMTPASTSVATGAQLPVRMESWFWDTYMQFNPEAEARLSLVARQRQEAVIDVYEVDATADILTDSEGEDVIYDVIGEKRRVFKTTDGRYFGGAISDYTEDGDAYNLFLRDGERQGDDQVETIEWLIEDLHEVDYNNDVPLYRGGSGDRGTSGKVFREGKFRVGDILVNTDITSFSENPYVARSFCSSEVGGIWSPERGPITFDDSSVIFELGARQYLNATPITPFSVTPSEAESVFLPGNYFRIQRVEEIVGNSYRFMNVELKQIPPEQVTGAAYDMRTGIQFSREEYAEKLGPDARDLVNYLFPLPR
ncbi:dermonecrotic toxin domain-containing protein [Pseudomonas sp. NPDC090202]|uniref:dermonecrotic toxin domain-containing protein n=1 Tax=unclassified Pseudomonas TaxID=196821 RepID=UPI00382807DA